MNDAAESKQDQAPDATGGSTNVGEWHVAQTSKQCHACHAPFLADQEYWSTLHVETGGEFPVLVRQDSCSNCWKPSGDHIYWKTRLKANREDQNVVDIQAMHQLFLQLVEDSRDEIEALRYVVALMLVRKKVLKIIRNVRGARGDLVFKDPRDDKKRMRLPTPELSEDKLERLKEQLGEILG